MAWGQVRLSDYMVAPESAGPVIEGNHITNIPLDDSRYVLFNASGACKMTPTGLTTEQEMGRLTLGPEGDIVTIGPDQDNFTIGPVAYGSAFGPMQDSVTFGSMQDGDTFVPMQDGFTTLPPQQNFSEEWVEGSLNQEPVAWSMISPEGYVVVHGITRLDEVGVTLVNVMSRV